MKTSGYWMSFVINWQFIIRLECWYIEGRRITDALTLEVTVMAYAGLANKKIVACLQAKRINACGLSGCDMNVIVSHKRAITDIDWGYVGDIEQVKEEVLAFLLERKIMPVLSPITCSAAGQLLNTNADSVASATAIALSRKYETELVFCLDKPGVLRNIQDENSVIPFIGRKAYIELLKEKNIHAGMLPKLENAFKTLDAGVKKVRLTSPADLEGGTVLMKE